MLVEGCGAGSVRRTARENEMNGDEPERGTKDGENLHEGERPPRQNERNHQRDERGSKRPTRGTEPKTMGPGLGAQA
jgi:hypothetical protein